VRGLSAGAFPPAAEQETSRPAHLTFQEKLTFTVRRNISSTGLPCILQAFLLKSGCSQCANSVYSLSLLTLHIDTHSAKMKVPEFVGPGHESTCRYCKQQGILQNTICAPSVGQA